MVWLRDVQIDAKDNFRAPGRYGSTNTRAAAHPIMLELLARLDDFAALR